jgi:hypothetical protein
MLTSFLPIFRRPNNQPSRNKVLIFSGSVKLLKIIKVRLLFFSFDVPFSAFG